MKEKYLKNGQCVNIVKKIEGGYLYQNILIDDYDIDFIDDDILYTDKLYDSPPLEKLHEKVIELKTSIKELKKETTEIKQVKQKEKSLLNEIKKSDFLQIIVDYFKRNFKYVLYLDRMEIIEKEKVYISDYIKVVNKKDGIYMYKLSSENYDSYDDKPIMIFNSFEDARDYAKIVLIKELKFNTENSNYPWGVRGVENWLKNIHYSNKLQDNKDILNIYKEKLNEVKTREDQKRKEKLQKEIEEKEKQLKEISN